VAAFLSVVVIYFAVAPLRVLAGWLGRQVHFLRWLRRLEGSATDIFFSKSQVSDPKGAT